MNDNLHDKRVTELIVIISLILFLNDLTIDIYPRIQDFSKERKLSCLSILLIHHLLSAYVTFGFLYNSKKKLAMVLAINGIIYLHWKTNDGMCMLTQYVNGECDFNDKQLFNDIWMITGLKEKKNEVVLYGLQLLIFIIIMSKLLK